MVTGTGGDVNWTVTYYDALSGGSNITANVTGGGWSTGALAGAATRDIRVEVIPGPAVSSGVLKEVIIITTSQADTNVRDMVKVVAVCGTFVDEVTCSFTDMVPEFIPLNKEEVLLKISLSVEHNAAWDGVRLSKIGTIQDIDIVAVRVYQDNGNQQFDGSDILVGEGTFVNGIVDIGLVPQNISNAIKSYFITCEIETNAEIGTTIGVECDPNMFSIVAPDGMASDLYCFYTRTAIVVEVIISKTVLHPNYPNPFRPGKDRTTTIQYDLSEDVNSIEIEIYSLAGELVREWSGNTRRGRHRILWDANNQGGKRISSGMYFVVIKENGKVMDRKRIVVIK